MTYFLCLFAMCPPMPSSLGGESDVFTIWSQNIGIIRHRFDDHRLHHRREDLRSSGHGSMVGQHPAGTRRFSMFFFFMFVLLFVYATIAHYPGTHLWGYVGLLWAATLQIIAGMFFACFDPPHHAHHIG